MDVRGTKCSMASYSNSMPVPIILHTLLRQLLQKLGAIFDNSTHKTNLKRVRGESAHGLKNTCSRFQLIPCCFLPNISPYTKFHPNRKKNTEVENICYWSVIVGQPGRSKHERRYLKLVNVFGPLSTPMRIPSKSDRKHRS